MASKKNKNIITRLQDWMDSPSGQSFLNYAYSWGAAIVILGALFKLTYIKGADIMLFIGMSTEVLVFIVSGFDRPSSARKENDTEVSAQEPVVANQGSVSIPQMGVGPVAGMETQAVSAMAAASAVDTQKLIEIIQESNKDLLEQARTVCNPEMGEAATGYVTQLKELTEVLQKVSEQTRHLAKDSEEMEKLNRTLTSINTIYEMQLKSISQQVGSMDQINDQTRRMAQLIEEMNGVYTRMIQALTINMQQAGGGMSNP